MHRIRKFIVHEHVETVALKTWRKVLKQCLIVYNWIITKRQQLWANGDDITLYIRCQEWSSNYMYMIPRAYLKLLDSSHETNL